jgi:inorganic pyrophosphatase
MKVPTEYLDKIISVEIDRPIFSKHPKHNFEYKLNYGYVPDTLSGDGEEIDVYVIGPNVPVKKFTGKCVAIIHRLNDDDDKLVVTSKEFESISNEDIGKLTNFQEKYFQIEIIRKS